MAQDVEKNSVLDDATADEAFAEVKNGYRDWEVDGVKYRTYAPVSEQETNAGWEYSRAFNRALKEGLPTNAEMDKTLRERGLWSDEEEKFISEAREKMGHLETILSKKDPKDSSKTTRKLVEELAVLRIEVLDKTNQYQSYMSQTVEAKADEAKTAYLVASCTVTESGEKVWPKVTDFITDRNALLVNNATYQYITFAAGLAPDYLEKLPEVRFLRAGKYDVEAPEKTK